MPDQASACQDTPRPAIACPVRPRPIGRARTRGRLVVRLAAMWVAVWQRILPQGGPRPLHYMSEAELCDIGASAELRARIEAVREFERHQSGSPYYF
ncbi:hypothetical protein BAU07_07855 [Bordetella flabilis]|uniref:Uncharacterized protein n=1 Tax=Bordetella flabilis TaxID=463014 RepID=A0A193GB26_9BORD|nr:hypothetical protein BAU07_07855 [Bordetella flabilis]